MSIVINGMDMPKTVSLWLMIKPDGNVYKIKNGGEYGEPKIGTAAPLPEKHGRLIDADALIASFRESVHESKKISEGGYADALQEVNEKAILTTFIEAILRTKAQPTVIEAEGGGDDA